MRGGSAMRGSPAAGTVLIGVLLAMVLLAQAVLVGLPAAPPLQDLPNHLARAVAIGDLLFDDGRQFSPFYEFDWVFAPYMLVDLLSACAVRLMGAQLTGQWLAILAAVLMPLAVVDCARRLGLERPAAGLAGLLAALVALDYMLFAGYLAFKFSAALSVFATGLLAQFLDRPTGRRWLWMACGAVATYLAHLAGFVMFISALCALCAAQWLVDRRCSGRIGAALAVGAAVSVLHLLSAAHGPAAAPYLFGTPTEKLHGILQSLRVHDTPLEQGLVLVTLALLGSAVFILGRRDALRLRSVLLGLAALGAYAILPQSQPGVTYDTDLRALPQLFGFAAIAVAAVLEPAHRARLVVALLATLLVVARLVDLAPYQAEQARRLAEFREVLVSLPRGARVFPVLTVRAERRVDPLRHAASYALVDRAAFVSYVFTGVEGGHLGHFRALQAAEPLVEKMWYAEAAEPPGSAALLARYDHLVAMLPFDPGRLQVCLELLGGNRVARVYRITGPRTGAQCGPSRDAPSVNRS